MMPVRFSWSFGLPFVSLSAVLILFAAAPLRAADPVNLSEAAVTERVYDVTTTVEADGQVRTTTLDRKALALKLNVAGNFAYQERRLPGGGRDAKAFRSVRKYSQAGARITVAEQVSTPRLRENLTLIVAEGEREGLQLFSPSGPLTYGELELLRTTGDSLAIQTLLPDEPVAVGDKWTPAEWVLQFLTNVEAVEKSQLSCQLEAVESGVARVTFEGSISGGINGAATEITVKGHLLFDIEQQFTKRLEITQSETRSVSPVSTGLQVTAKAVMERKLSTSAGTLSPESLEGVPLESNPASLLVLFEAQPWGIRCYHGRHWHLYFHGPQEAVLRMVERGSLIAQCNLFKIAPARPGQHVDPKQFERDVQRALGSNFERIAQSEVIPTEDGRFIYRVAAIGQSQQPVPAESAAGEADKKTEGAAEKLTDKSGANAQPVPDAKTPASNSGDGAKSTEKKPPETAVAVIPMMWIYYLVAGPQGHQVVLAFTIEASLLEQFGTQDLTIVSGVEFPQQAEGPSLAK